MDQQHWFFYKKYQPLVKILIALALPFIPLSLLLSLPAPAWAAYSSAISGNTATLTGDPDGDTIIIDVEGNNLRHNLPTSPATFETNLDWDSSQPFVQTLSNNANVTIIINAGDGDDVISLGSASVPASQLQASFNVNGQGDANEDTLIIDNSADATSRNVTVSSTSSVSGMGLSPSISGIEIMELKTGFGTDTFQVGSAGNSLDNLNTVTLNPGGGTDTLQVNDQGDTTANIYQVSNASVKRTNGPDVTINYSNFESLLLNTGAITDTITVQSSLAATPIQLNSGDGNDALTVGANTLDDVLGLLTISGGASGFDTLTVNDASDTSPNTYTATLSSVQRGFITILNYEATIDSLSFKGGTNSSDYLVITGTVAGPSNNYTVSSTAVHRTGVATVTYNTLENLLIQGSLVADVFNLQSTAISTTLTGDAGDDVFIFADGVTLLGGTIDGGAGADKIDYAAYSSAVSVNFPAATGTAGVSSIRDVTGGSGNDAFTGNANDNTFSGGSGDDTFNGGGGADTLIGGPGNDKYTFQSGWGIDSVVESAGQGLDTMNFNSLTIPLTITISSVTVTDGTNRATHAANEIEIIESGSGDDIFDVHASALINRAITLRGKSHINGDALTFRSGGLSVITTPNSITAQGRQPLSHFDMEQVTINSTGELIFIPIIGRGF